MVMLWCGSGRGGWSACHESQDDGEDVFAGDANDIARSMLPLLMTMMPLMKSFSQ